MTDAGTIRTATSLGAVGFGIAGALAPGALARAYGTTDPTPEHLYTVRIWAGATAAFGAVGLMADGLDDRRFLQLGLALNAFDAAFGPLPAAVPSFPSRLPLLALDRMIANREGMLSPVTAHDTPLARLASDHLPIKAYVSLASAHATAAKSDLEAA